MSASVRVAVEGRELSLSNLDKVLYPATGFTKAQVIDYYTRIGPVMLPHVRGRPMTLKRFPDGVEGESFFEKQCPSHRPEWVHVAPLWSESSHRTISFCLVDDQPTLAWLANLAALELHASLALAEQPSTPTAVAFDLDPGAPADFVDCCRVARILRDALGHLGLQTFPKSSGLKGLQVYVPLNTPATYDDTKGFAYAIARIMEKQHPDLVLSNMRRDLRRGKVFIDWSQNSEHKTTVAVYSLRAAERPMVSAPLSWDEVEAVVARGNPALGMFDAEQVLERVAERGDLFERVATLKQHLPRA